jgi:hypothetical protein
MAHAEADFVHAPLSKSGTAPSKPNVHVLRADPKNRPVSDELYIPNFQSICAATLGMIIFLALTGFW